MSMYNDYLKEIEERKALALHPKPIEGGELLSEIITQIKDVANVHRADSLKFFIYNTVPGTTPAAAVKAKFLKEIILGGAVVKEITPAFALELLSHMKGGPSIEVLLDLALGNDVAIAKGAATVLKTQVFLYEADMARLEKAFKDGNAIAKDLLESYAKAEFFTKLPEVEEEIEIVTFIAGEGDISTDLLSPGADAHSRSDRELHGQCIFEHNKDQQKALTALKAKFPTKRVMLIAEKGTMGVGSSRMSGVNNVALWTGKPASPYIPFINIAPIIAGTNGTAPIFLTTVGVTGGIGIDLKNWVKKLDANGNAIRNADGDVVLEEAYSVATGTEFTINTKKKKLYKGDKEVIDISDSLTPQKVEFIKAGGSYAIVFGKKLQTFAAKTLGIEAPTVFAPSKEITIAGQGLTAVDLNILATAGQKVNIESIGFDGTVVTGATSITSTAFTGTLATAAQPNVTSLGTLTTLTVDNIVVNGNDISSTAGNLTITPVAGAKIVLDGTINVDAGVVTGATSITSTAFVGTLSTAAQTNITLYLSDRPKGDNVFPVPVGAIHNTSLALGLLQVVNNSF